MKRYYSKLPFWFKMWWAKQFIYMFKSFGPTFDNDITLYNELRLWIDTKGKPNKQSGGGMIDA